MLGEILFIGCKDPLLNITNFIKVFVFGKALYGFRHPADKIIVLQSINICLLEARDHLEVLAIQKCGKLLFAGCHQKLFERKGI